MKIILNSDTEYDRQIIAKLFYNSEKCGCNENCGIEKPQREHKITKPLRAVKPEDIQDAVESTKGVKQKPSVKENCEAIKNEEYYEKLAEMDLPSIYESLNRDSLTLQEIRLLCNKASLALGHDGVRKIKAELASLGVNHPGELIESDYAIFFDRVKASVESGIDNV